MNTKISCFAALASAALLTNPVSAQVIADTIYSGGPILPINDTQPSAEAVAVKNGHIVAVGSLSDIAIHQGDATELFDLDGRAMLPGFVDSHGHAIMGGLQALSANLLAAPDGDVTDIPSLQDTLRSWIAANAEIVDKAQLIVGFGYDQSQLTELRHPTREDLDEISTDVPIIIVHQSGHFGVANSKALELVPITAPLTNFFIILTKETAILSVVTVPELLYETQTMAAETFTYIEPFLVLSLFYWLMVLGTSWLGGKVEAVLAANPGLGALGAVLEPGVRILLPDLVTSEPSETAQLWG